MHSFRDLDLPSALPVTASIDSLLDDCAGAHHGVLSAAQARALGINRAAVSRRVAAGRMAIELPGVYRWGPSVRHLTRDGQMMAAVLHGGPGAALSHGCAAIRLRGWRRAVRRIHVVVPGDRRLPTKSGVVIHRAPPLLKGDIVVLDGIPTTSALRTCCDLGATHTKHQLASVLDELVFLRVLEIATLSRYALARGPVTGAGVVRSAIALHLAGSAGTRSTSEDLLLTALLDVRCPEPQVNLRGATGIPGVEVDFAWPREQLVVEVDGPSHDRPGADAQDAARDDALRSAGWHVLRIPTRRIWNDLPAAVREIQTLLLRQVAAARS